MESSTNRNHPQAQWSLRRPFKKESFVNGWQPQASLPDNKKTSMNAACPKPLVARLYIT